MQGQTLGPVYTHDPYRVPLDVWRYKLDEHGKRTGYVVREKGRPALDVLADLAYEARELLEDVEYADVCYSFGCRPDGDRDRRAKVPNTARIACYAVTGGNEGHYVHVDVHTTDREQVPLFLVKTFMGMEHAWKIAIRFAELLGA